MESIQKLIDKLKIKPQVVEEQITPLTTLTSKQLIGLSKFDAIKLIKKHGMTHRITKEDGNYFFGTCEIDINRVNIEILNDKVTNIAIG